MKDFLDNTGVRDTNSLQLKIPRYSKVNCTQQSGTRKQLIAIKDDWVTIVSHWSKGSKETQEMR